MAVGTWTPLTRTAPSAVDLMLLLSDGTVMVQQSGVSSNWYRLSAGHPRELCQRHLDDSGRNARRAPLFLLGRPYQTSRVFVAGGEYGAGGVLHSPN